MTIALIVFFSIIALFLPVLPIIDAWQAERRKVDGRLILPAARVKQAAVSGSYRR